MAKSIIEQLTDLLDADGKAKLATLLAANPKVAVDDRRMSELFGIYLGADDTPASASTSEPAAAATHTPALPAAAATTSAPAPASSATAPNPELKSILDTLTGLKTSIDERFKNVVTMDKVNELGAQLLNTATARALKQADEISLIRETNRKEFGVEMDRAVFEKFVTDAEFEVEDPTTHVKVKRNKYSTLTDAYNAMVSQQRIDAKIAAGIAEGVKQKTSGATVPGQTTSSALSPAQQVMAKEKAKARIDGGTGLKDLIARAELLERSKAEAGTVQ